MVNKAIVLGRLGKDPEIKVTTIGKKKASFTVATSEKYKDKNTQEMKENTEWHNVVAWGQLAEIIERLDLKKGGLVYVEGKNTTRIWDDPAEQKRYTHEIVIHEIKTLSPRQNVSSSGNFGSNNQQQTASQAEAKYDAAADDIPF